MIHTTNPTATLNGLVNELFNDLPNVFGKSITDSLLHHPQVNILENKYGYLMDVIAPGLAKEDFSVKVDGKILTVSANKKEDVKEENEDSIFRTVRTEYSVKTFKRSFTLKDSIDKNSVSAKYENGILKVWLPKKEEEVKPAAEITIQ